MDWKFPAGFYAVSVVLLLIGTGDVLFSLIAAAGFSFMALIGFLAMLVDHLGRW